ncbi:hypothetical protein C7H85_15145 [Zobellella endophytica]|uniref:Transposase DDE domain-containing protein n=2 Tax=Zobellella endophytica TaxID=2116700 RepID=A0A2P7R1J7_9GAMM|nr:hypothetical protein C7H85_15145 [Zobellella endophytica]
MDEEAIRQWYCHQHMDAGDAAFTIVTSPSKPSSRSRTSLACHCGRWKRFINSIFQLMDIPLTSPGYSCICQRARTVNVQYRLPNKGAVTPLVIDVIGLNLRRHRETGYVPPPD